MADRKWTREQLLDLEIPDAICDCDSSPTHDATGSPFYPPCKHQREYAPDGLSPEEWYSQFPDTARTDQSNRTEWAWLLLLAFGKEIEDRTELDRPFKTLKRETRIKVLRRRYKEGLSLWHPEDQIDMPSAGVEATGRKKNISGDVIFKGEKKHQ